VVHVPIDDRDPAQPIGAERGGGDRHVVQQAEPASVTGRGVVTGRTHGRKGHHRVSGGHGAGSLHSGAGRQTSGRE
jgi:hypothetical protein